MMIRHNLAAAIYAIAMLHLHLHAKRIIQIVDSRRKSGLRPTFPNQTVNQGTDE